MSRLVRATVAPARTAAPLAFSRPASGGALCPPALPLSLYQDLLGKPFAEDGRGPASYDCVGLVLELASRRGKTLPSFLSTEAEFHAQLGAGASTLADLPHIAVPVAGCIVLLRMSVAEHHVGMMVDTYRMIHVMKGINVSIERVLSPLWQRKVMGYYSL